MRMSAESVRRHGHGVAPERLQQGPRTQGCPGAVDCPACVPTLSTLTSRARSVLIHPMAPGHIGGDKGIAVAVAADPRAGTG